MRRFEIGGFKAVGLNRSVVSQPDSLDIRQVDLANPEQLRNTLSTIIEKHGPPKIVIHNPSQLIIQPFAQTRVAEFEACWRSTALSAVILAQSVMMPMVRGGGGTFIVSGATASLRGGKNFAAFASAKFALRGLTQSLAREYQSAGIHVAHVILDGIIDTQRSRGLHGIDSAQMMKPEDIAENYWQIAHQPRSTWSHEIDLRPQGESF